jgi:hypothetical protein
MPPSEYWIRTFSGVAYFNRQRRPMSQQAFIDYFTSRGYYRVIAEMIREEIELYLHIDDINLYPDDRLSDIWGIDVEDLAGFDDSLIYNIFKRLKIPLPTDVMLMEYESKNGLTTDTPLSIIDYFQFCFDRYFEELNGNN